MHATSSHFAARVGGFFGALFLVYGATLPYLPVLLDARGLTAAEIGLVSSVPLIVRLVLTPVIAVAADRHGAHRGVIVALAALGLAAISGVAVARGFWPLLLTVAIFQVAVQSTMPLIETIAMAGVGRGGHDYGRMRLVGSVTFIVATFAGAAAIERYGVAVVAPLLIAATVATLAAACLLPVTLAGEATNRRGKVDFGSFVALVRSPEVLLFLVAAGSVQSAHAVFYAFGVLHWRAGGIPSAWIGALWSIGVIAEIALFWASTRVMRHFGAVDLIVIGAIAAVVRWVAMAFDPPLILLVPLQMLHGLTYGASHLGAMHFIKAHVPSHQAGTAQALYSTATAGVGMGLAMILAGHAYTHFGGQGYLSMALLSLASVASAVALRRRQS